MPKPRFSSLFLRLSRDQNLRRKFAENPQEFLRDEGFDPSRLELPSNIDLATLDARVEGAFGNDSDDWTASEAEVASMSADELWSRFGVIGEKSESDDNATASPLVAVVAYGTSVVTTEGATIAFERARTMRGLMRLRKSDLTFSVKGPDGVAVEDLPAATIEALLRRLE